MNVKTYGREVLAMARSLVVARNETVRSNAGAQEGTAVVVLCWAARQGSSAVRHRSAGREIGSRIQHT
jgi:hypothetical protein